MKTVWLFVGLSAPSVLTAQVNPRHSARDSGRPYRKVEDEVPTPTTQLYDGRGEGQFETMRFRNNRYSVVGVLNSERVQRRPTLALHAASNLAPLWRR